MALPDDIKVFPAFLQGMVDRVNALLKAVRPLDALEVTAPLTLSKTDKVARLGVSRPALQDALRGIITPEAFADYAFRIYETTANKISLTPGLLNNITPTLGGTALTDPTPPQSSALSDATHLVYLAVTTNSSGVATSVTVGIATTLPTDTDTLAHIQLGQVVVASGAITTITQQRRGSLWHQRCGESEHLFGSAG
jgi:hypothetical protein